MRTETIRVDVYEFSELSEEVQDRVISRWRDEDHFVWGSEWQESLKKFCHRVGSLPFSLVDYEIHPGNGTAWVRWGNYQADPDRPFDYDIPTDGSCPLTGYVGDEDLIDGIRESEPGASYRDVVTRCLKSWAKAYAKDIEYWMSEEAIREDIAELGPEFTEDGKVWVRP